jgi:THO complex subunit 4
VEAGSVSVPEAKPLSERVAYANPNRAKKSAPLTKDSANPKAQPKSATAAKPATKDAKGRKVKDTKKKTRTARPKPKTAEELDAEMTDYFNANNNNNATAAGAATNGGAAAAGDDMGMDEISVSSLEIIV